MRRKFLIAAWLFSAVTTATVITVVVWPTPKGVAAIITGLVFTATFLWGARRS